MPLTGRPRDGLARNSWAHRCGPTLILRKEPFWARDGKAELLIRNDKRQRSR
jgi:hypothetical protein